MMIDLEARRVATEQTLALYRDKIFNWRTGITCVHFARRHLKNLGHKPPTLPRFRSPSTAKRALKEHGWSSVSDMLDSLLPRIVPAQMVLGDLAVTPGQDGLDCILVSAGPLKLMGWHPDDGRFVMYDNAIAEVTGAWRV